MCFITILAIYVPGQILFWKIWIKNWDGVRPPLKFFFFFGISLLKAPLHRMMVLWYDIASIVNIVNIVGQY